DPRHAAELYERSCNGGNAGACSLSADIYMNGSGVAKDENKAAELYRRACDAGNADGCANLEKLNVKR
ncbi:MAG: hypothetical protein JWO19_6008, partial [Bryobacterales bacterium]|nr:hypothetical protein [Bryobacterales bacterium]